MGLKKFFKLSRGKIVFSLLFPILTGFLYFAFILFLSIVFDCGIWGSVDNCRKWDSIIIPMAFILSYIIGFGGAVGQKIFFIFFNANDYYSWYGYGWLRDFLGFIFQAFYSYFIACTAIFLFSKYKSKKINK